MEEKPCYICGQLTEFTCQTCGEPACEDCMVPFTLQNQIDYCLCNECHEIGEMNRANDAYDEEKRQEERKAKKEAASAKRRANYWKPENIEKRRVAAIKCKEEKVAAERERAKEAAKIMGSMFKGMF